MNSPQLILVFEDMPWNGVSPRGLTRAAKRFNFLRKGMAPPKAKAKDPEQLELFPEGTSYGT